MSQKKQAVQDMLDIALEDLLLVKSLFKLMPDEIAPWGAALGENDHKKIATKLNKTFDLLLPGLISFPIPDINKHQSTNGAQRIVSLNIFSKEKALCELSQFALHSPKLTFADADKSIAIPIDRALPFENSNSIIGAHSINAGSALDFYSGANNSSAFKQIRHIMLSGGDYIFPEGISVDDFPDTVMRHLVDMASVVSSGALYAKRDVSVIQGLPQVLIADATSPTGYISVTPLACGGVLVAASKSIRAYSFDQNELVALGEARKGLRSASFMPCVANKQNLSGIIGPAKSIYFGTPPLIDKDARSAFSLTNKTGEWMQNKFTNLIKSKEEKSFRRCLVVLQEHVSEILGRSENDDKCTQKDSVTKTERDHEINTIKLMTRIFCKDLFNLCENQKEYIESSEFNLSEFNVNYCATFMLPCFLKNIGLSLSEHTRNVWQNAIESEIHLQLNKNKGELCG